jgi:hypothetical protein
MAPPSTSEKPPAQECLLLPAAAKQSVRHRQSPLIAYSLMGRGKAVKVAFLALDRPDQLDFFGLARFQSLVAGNLTYSLDFHACTSM